VMRRDATGRSRISCSRLGPEDATSAVMALTDADFAGTPRNETDEDVRNRYAIALNYDDEDEAQVNVVVSDLRSQRTHGEARELSLELRGLRMEDSGANAPQRLLRPLYTRLMAMLGDPRRVWVVRVHAGVGLQLQLGDVVTVTSRYLRGSAWTAGGVAQVAARVVGITVDPVRETADLRLLHYGSAGTAWNASARVASVPAADEVVVEANIYADAEHPVTGEALEDLDGFQLGDVVRALPTGDHDMIGGGAAGLTITGINRLTRTITFDAPHGITMPTGGDIEPDSYDLAAAHHQVLAYLADAAGTLGAAAVAGQEAV